MSKRLIAVIPGDGIGPEITEATISILEATGFSAEWVFLEGGLGAVVKGLPAMPLEVAEACSGIRSLMSLGTLAIEPMCLPSANTLYRSMCAE